MTSEEFIKLNKNIGLNIIDTETTSWAILHDKYAISMPSLEVCHPSKKDIDQILSNKNVWFCMFVSESNDSNTAEYYFEGDSYELENFSSKIRNQIKKSLKSCDFRKPSLEDLKQYGLEINKEILGLHNRKVDYLIEQTLWEKYIEELYINKDVYVYAAYIEDIFVAYILFIKVNDKYYIYHPFASRKFSKQAPMNGLLFTAIKDFIKKDSSVYITYGLASFFSMSGLDKFKKGMLFKEKPVSRIIVMDKKIDIFFNKYINMLLFKLSKIDKIKTLYEKYTIFYKAKQLYGDIK